MWTSFADNYRYDKRPLEPNVDSTREDLLWRLETVSFTAGYGNEDERIQALLFLPKNSQPPYQTVVWFPMPEAASKGARLGDGSSDRRWFSFIVQSGRAVCLPAVKGTFERNLGRGARNVWSEMMPSASKDIGRTIDYLATRDDIDAGRLAYFGQSLGAAAAPIMTALEPRFKASVLVGGGFPPHRPLAYADPLNFAPRVRVPTLMLNGEHEYFYRYETSQKPMFDLLGTPNKDHVRFQSGHIPIERHQLHKEVLAWLDKYLGSVRHR
jgi:dienelactone hydrolase